MSDAEYLEIALAPVRACADCRPKFGRGRDGGCDLARFREMCRADAFYSWFGLDDPLVYAAHKAAGGLTSVCRQIGIGGERLARRIICDRLGLSEKLAVWSYQPPGGRRLSLDARIVPADIAAAALSRELLDEKLDLLVASPPYANRMSCIRELRPRMYWLGRLRAPGEAGELDWRAIGGAWGAAASRLAEWRTTAPVPPRLKKIAAQVAARRP